MGVSGRANPGGAGGGGAQSPREGNTHGISGVSPEDQRIATEKRARAMAYSKGLKQGRRQGLTLVHIFAQPEPFCH
jgi:hypothetical protein